MTTAYLVVWGALFVLWSIQWTAGCSAIVRAINGLRQELEITNGKKRPH